MAAAKLGLGTRLGLGFGLILILLAVVAYFGISRLAAINTALDDIVNNKNPKVELANDMQDQINIIARAVRNIALSDDASFIKQEKERIDKSRGKFTANYNRLQETVVSKEGKDILNRIKWSQGATDPLVDKALALGLAHKNAEAAQVLFNEVRQPQGRLLADLEALVAEIAGASGEQAQGVEQINQAVNEMNQVTQQVAANAEESASASEELNAQATQSRTFVEELVELVYGGKSSRFARGSATRVTGRMQVAESPRDTGRSREEHFPRLTGANPKEIIPLEEDDFKSF